MFESSSAASSTQARVSQTGSASHSPSWYSTCCPAACDEAPPSSTEQSSTVQKTLQMTQEVVWRRRVLRSGGGS